MQPASTAQLNSNSIDQATAATLPEGALEASVERARDHLMSLQDPGGWWKAAAPRLSAEAYQRRLTLR